MQKMKTARLFSLCWIVCAGLTLFLAAPAAADWTNLESMLDFDTELSVLGPDPACETEPECIPGLIELPLFDEFGNQLQLKVNDIVKVKATLDVKTDMPLPFQVRLVFGGLGYQTAPRIWTLRQDGIYTNSAYFMVTNEGEDKPIGAKVWVRWVPEGETLSTIDTNTILDSITVVTTVP